MKHRNRVIANRPYTACVKPKQFGLLDIMALLLPIRKYRHLDAFFTISPIRHVYTSMVIKDLLATSVVLAGTNARDYSGGLNEHKCPC